MYLQWSDKAKTFDNHVVKKYQEKLANINNCPDDTENSHISELLAARTDQAIIEKTSSAANRKNTTCKIQKHVIGRVSVILIIILIDGA